MDKFESDAKLIEKLARSEHEIFCAFMISQGFHFGKTNSEESKTHSSLIPFDELPEYEKEQNRGTVRDIISKLTYLGYSLQSATENNIPYEFSSDEIETLAEQEHERWVRQKILSGWKYAVVPDKSQKKHNNIVPWKQLSEADKEKDRVMVRSIPQIVAKAGYKIVKITN